MKVRITVTLSEELLHAIETEVKMENRSAFIERDVLDYSTRAGLATQMNIGIRELFLFKIFVNQR